VLLTGTRHGPAELFAEICFAQFFNSSNSYRSSWCVLLFKADPLSELANSFSFADSAARKDEEEDVLSIPFSRTLSQDNPHNPYEHNFPAAVATTCYRSSFYSPYRMYSSTINTANPNSVIFSFYIEVAECPYSQAFCCNQNLDHIFVSIGEFGSATSLMFLNM
jgi:hypothetical protein